MSAGLFALMSKKGREEKREKELKAAFDAADKDGDGKLDLEEWIQILKDTGIEVSRDEVEVMFLEKDRDRDGSLSFKEFMGQETPMEKAFKVMDKDNDGFVTKQEFKRVCKNLSNEQIAAAFKKFDAAGDGKLNYVEFCDLMNRRKNQAKQQAAAAAAAAAAASNPTATAAAAANSSAK